MKKMMTRKEFEEKVIRAAEKRDGLPEGWWGAYYSFFTSPAVRGVQVVGVIAGMKGWRLQRFYKGKLTHQLYAYRELALKRAKRWVEAAPTKLDDVRFAMPRPKAKKKASRAARTPHQGF